MHAHVHIVEMSAKQKQQQPAELPTGWLACKAGKAHHTNTLMYTGCMQPLHPAAGWEAINSQPAGSNCQEQGPHSPWQPANNDAVLIVLRPLCLFIAGRVSLQQRRGYTAALLIMVEPSPRRTHGTQQPCHVVAPRYGTMTAFSPHGRCPAPSAPQSASQGTSSGSNLQLAVVLSHSQVPVHHFQPPSPSLHAEQALRKACQALAQWGIAQPGLPTTGATKAAGLKLLHRCW